jgi:hypothetical protein
VKVGDAFTVKLSGGWQLDMLDNIDVTAACSPDKCGTGRIGFFRQSIYGGK